MDLLKIKKKLTIKDAKLTESMKFLEEEIVRAEENLINTDGELSLISQSFKEGVNSGYLKGLKYCKGLIDNA